MAGDVHQMQASVTVRVGPNKKARLLHPSSSDAGQYHRCLALLSSRWVSMFPLDPARLQMSRGPSDPPQVPKRPTTNPRLDQRMAGVRVRAQKLTLSQAQTVPSHPPDHCVLQCHPGLPAPLNKQCPRRSGTGQLVPLQRITALLRACPLMTSAPPRRMVVVPSDLQLLPNLVPRPHPQFLLPTLLVPLSARPRNTSNPLPIIYMASHRFLYLPSATLLVPP
jgi:hypothetical protein